MDSGGPLGLLCGEPSSEGSISNIDRRLATELERSLRVRGRALSGDSSREPDLDGGVRTAGRVKELALSTTDGDREASRLCLTEKKVDWGRSRLAVVGMGLASPV